MCRLLAARNIDFESVNQQILHELLIIYDPDGKGILRGAQGLV